MGAAGASSSLDGIEAEEAGEIGSDFIVGVKRLLSTPTPSI
jgi:hypothetical protein